jgi:CBS domain-containing protein
MSNVQPTRCLAESPSVTELFHRINSLIPNDQKLVSVPPRMPAAAALELLEKAGFSQAPVVFGHEVLGLFSYRSYSRAVTVYSQKAPRNRKFEPLELVVEECMDPKPHFARVTDEFVEWFDVIDRADAVLVGEPNRLQAIVTAMDILRYLYRVASPFVLIGETERALRALMQMAVVLRPSRRSRESALKINTTRTEYLHN